MMDSVQEHEKTDRRQTFKNGTVLYSLKVVMLTT